MRCKCFTNLSLIFCITHFSISKRLDLSTQYYYVKNKSRKFIYLALIYVSSECQAVYNNDIEHIVNYLKKNYLNYNFEILTFAVFELYAVSVTYVLVFISYYIPYGGQGC